MSNVHTIQEYVTAATYDADINAVLLEAKKLSKHIIELTKAKHRDETLIRRLADELEKKNEIIDELRERVKEPTIRGGSQVNFKELYSGFVTVLKPTAKEQEEYEKYADEFLKRYQR